MTPPLWTANEIAAATGGSLDGNFAPITGLSIDSRTLDPGDLFIALRGPNFDGHDFIEAAMAYGAAGILSTERCKAPHIQVTDSSAALTALGAAARARFSGQVICITGSMGKTTTRALTAAAFGSFSRTHASLGNLNNHLGVPLTLARLPRDAETAVVEIGMSHFGEIKALSRLTRPHAALITALDWVHSQNLGETLEGVAQAKAEICAGLDGPLFAPIALKGLLKPHLSSQEVNWIDTPYTGRLALLGEENRWNAALALAAVPAGQRSVAEAALAKVNAVPGRGDVLRLCIDGKDVTVLNHAYNATPASMRAAVKNLVAQGEGRHLAIVGDMAELAEAERHHRDLGRFLAEAGPDMIVAVGQFHPSILAPLPPSIATAGWDDPEQVVPYLRPLLSQGDHILVKASNSTNLSRVVADLQAVSSS